MKQKKKKQQIKKIKGSTKILYKKKRWTKDELLLFLADKVSELEKNQCKPETECLFKAQNHLDNQFLEPRYDLDWNGEDPLF